MKKPRSSSDDTSSGESGSDDEKGQEVKESGDKPDSEGSISAERN